MPNYKDFPGNKKAFIFEFDNVLYPEKDYLLQVYYLFASFLEYTEAFPPAEDLTAFFKKSYEHQGAEGIFERASEAFGIDSKYKENFLRLHKTARLPLKLLLFEEMNTLLQDIIINEKKVFLVINGDVEQQFNKIRQTEWKGLEHNLIVYFVEESQTKSKADVLKLILQKYQLGQNDVLLAGNSEADQKSAEAAGIDYYSLTD